VGSASLEVQILPLPLKLNTITTDEGINYYIEEIRRVKKIFKNGEVHAVLTELEYYGLNKLKEESLKKI